MISADTNLFARLLLKDDPAQYRRAVALLAASDEVFVPVTVLLELAWVLRIRDSTREEIVSSLRAILAMPHVKPQHPEAVHRALDWVEQGVDIADAFHLALSDKAIRFFTFDATLARRAVRLGARPPVSTP
ncbi:MAG: type II toxin-antitoxin system VapC family toxin [Casimicrobiaceae bacterium]